MNENCIYLTHLDILETNNCVEFFMYKKLMTNKVQEILSRRVVVGSQSRVVDVNSSNCVLFRNDEFPVNLT